MHKKDKVPPIGQLIKEKLEESGMTVTEFAKRIHTSRRSVYELFSKNDINTNVLHNIAKVLGSDWIVEYFIQKYQYSHHKKDEQGLNEEMLIRQLKEYFSDIRNNIYEVKAMQHFIIDLLEKK